MASVTLGERIRKKLLRGSMCADDLVYAVIQDLCGEDPRKLLRGEEKHGPKVRQELRRLMEREEVVVGRELRLELTSGALNV